jgi:hypothetical protein
VITRLHITELQRRYCWREKNQTVLGSTKPFVRYRHWPAWPWPSLELMCSRILSCVGTLNSIANGPFLPHLSIAVDYVYLYLLRWWQNLLILWLTGLTTVPFAKCIFFSFQLHRIYTNILPCFMVDFCVYQFEMGNENDLVATASNVWGQNKCSVVWNSAPRKWRPDEIVSMQD